MKKLLALSAAVFGITVLFTGCSSDDLTGKWKYTYGKDNKGDMILSQENADITGVADNMSGHYIISGKVVDSTLTFEGKSDKNMYTANCTITSSNKFKGIYNTSTGDSGKVEAERQ